MAQTAALIGALKQVLKSRGVTYAEVARRLSLSEASIKRVFAKETFTLRRLDEICQLLGIEITDLARVVEHEADAVTHLTLEQEKQLVSEPKLLLVAVHALNQSTLGEIGRARVQPTEWIRSRPPGRLRIVDLLPNNRIRLIVARNFSWLPDGPIQRHFRGQLEANFFSSRFDGKGEQLGIRQRHALAQLEHGHPACHATPGRRIHRAAQPGRRLAARRAVRHQPPDRDSPLDARDVQEAGAQACAEDVLSLSGDRCSLTVDSRTPRVVGPRGALH